MQGKRIKASRLLNRILKFTLGIYLKRRFHMSFDDEAIKALKPPYLIFANHTNTWDPFLLSIPLPEPVHFVTSDIHFRNRKLRWLLRLAGCIPKTKFMSDAQTIKSILQVKNRRGLIGVFPEGERNWDGKTLPLLYPTAKLVKLLKIPVVTCLMKGVHLSLPRWGKSSRIGQMKLSYHVALDEKDIERMTAEEVYQVLTDRLAYDEYQFQQQHRIPFKSKEAAEYLELYLFTCPDCKTFGFLHSSGNRFTCKHCGYTVEYDEYGFFRKISGDLYFRHPGEWNQWQCQYLQSLIRSCDSGSDSFIFCDDDTAMRTGNKRLPMKKLQKGSLMMYPDRIVFMPISGNPFVFPVGKISGINVQWNHVLEFYYDNILYSFLFRTRRISAYKWVQAVKLARSDEPARIKT